MLSVGTEAPGFTLPGVSDDEIGSHALADYLGTDVVVLAFYPGDFNTTCTEEMESLRDMDLFGLDRVVTVLGISTDTAFSHRAFAAEYDLSFPLLSDNAGEVAERYGALYDEFEGHSRLCQRALFVVDPEGIIRYVWQADDPSQLPDADTVRDRIGDLGTDETALARYRAATDTHASAQTAFESAGEAYETEDWLAARPAFERAAAGFDTATEQFLSARAFGESAAVETATDRALERDRALRQAAEWFAEAADRFAVGDGTEGEAVESDASARLADARRVDDPPSAATLATDLDLAAPADGDDTTGQ